LNPSQLRFRVQGASKPTEEEKKKGKEQERLPLVVESTSLNDLPLKPSRREQAVSPEFSQPSVEEDLSAATTEPAEEFASEEGDSRIIRERDVLDDIIDQAKATSHLVNHVIPLLEAQATDLYT
jgi:DNA polymerase IV